MYSSYECESPHLIYSEKLKNLKDVFNFEGCASDRHRLVMTEDYYFFLYNVYILRFSYFLPAYTVIRF